jgi:outer membrane protein assembly factor BamE (lipoprotein component of BamABCDE complex)
MVSCRALRRNRGNIIGVWSGLKAFLPRLRQRRSRCKAEMKRLGSKIVRRKPALHLSLALAGVLALAACGSTTETLQRGYVLPEGALEQVPVGATQEQVLIVLGTPSTVATVNGDAFYYISQKAQRSAAFMPHEVVDQRVIAIYFDKERRVTRLANYGYKDGKIFDFVSQTTPTGGQELSYLRNIFKNVGVHL